MTSRGKRNTGNVGEDVDGPRFNATPNGEKPETLPNAYLGPFSHSSALGEGFRLLNTRVSTIVVLIDGSTETFSS